MRWYYKFLSFEDGVYRYAYSRECEDFDGVIIYLTKQKKTVIEKPDKMDEGNERGQERTMRHFLAVVNEGFPDYRYVATG